MENELRRKKGIVTDLEGLAIAEPEKMGPESHVHGLGKSVDIRSRKAGDKIKRHFGDRTDGPCCEHPYEEKTKWLQ